MTANDPESRSVKNIVFYSYLEKPPAPGPAAGPDCGGGTQGPIPDREGEPGPARTAALVLRLAGRLRAARRNGPRGGYDLGRHIALVRALRAAAAALKRWERERG